MPTTRRMNGITSRQPSSPSDAMPASTSKASVDVPPPTHSAYIPTRTEALLLFIYPLTLLLGSLFSYLSPSLRPPFNASTYSEVHQSFQPASAAPSYFAQKRNIFNVYFVKISWFWCTIAFVAFAIFVAKGRSSLSGATTSGGRNPKTRKSGNQNALQRQEWDERLRRWWQAALRYLAATAFWVVTTQWFFGAALVDRGFALTGGMCEIASEKLRELELSGGSEVAAKQKEEAARLVSHAACKVAGGLWKGGYDISGHVFILVLGSGMLWLEMLPFLLPGVKGLGLGRVVKTSAGKECRVVHEMAQGSHGSAEDIQNEDTGTSEREKTGWALKELATTLGLAVVVLSWWMLLMTAAYFHTWFEKLTGYVWASFALWTVYFLPRGQPVLRSVLGMPGV